MVKTVRIGYLSTAYHTSFILMGANWIEERIRTRAEWRLFPTGPDMIKAFAKGKLDIGYLGLTPAMIGVSKELPIKCVGGGHMEGTVFTAKRNFMTLNERGSVKETLNQFKGKAIGTPTKGSIHDVIIRNLLEKSKLQQDVIVRNFSWADQILEAMEDNEVDAGVGTPPLAVLASRLLGANVILPPHIMWPHNPSYGIIATTGMINGSSDILQDFLRLHEEACNMIRTCPDEAAEIAAKTLGMVDKDFILEVYAVSPKYCASLSEDYIDSTLAFVPFLQKTGYVSKSISPEDIFHTNFIEKVHREKPHYDDAGVLI